MKQIRFSLLAAVIIILQLVLTKYCQATPFLHITLLPALVLCEPFSRPQSLVMTLAFATGLIVDALAEGVWGLNAVALVPVALARPLIVGRTINEDIVRRGYAFSIRRNGLGKISVALILSTAIFCLLYSILDGGGVRSFGFIAASFVLSALASFIPGLFVVNVLCPEERN